MEVSLVFGLNFRIGTQSRQGLHHPEKNPGPGTYQHDDKVYSYVNIN